MELLTTRREESGSGRIRLVGTVAYDDRSLAAEEYWFEFPREYADALTDSGNPWLVCLAPLAAWLGEPLRIGLPVDALLFRNLREVMAIWKSWYPRTKVVPILVPGGGARTTDAGEGRTALFFSGGVDSQYSLFRNEQDEAGALPVDDLIAIQGFDIPLAKADAFERHLGRLAVVAQATGKTLVPAATNLRRTRLHEAPWGEFWHGCALAAVGLTLESRYRRLTIASANHYADLEPWGSHPMTDPLLSTAGTLVLHDGATRRRWEKLDLVARHDEALRSLHVCYRDLSDANCGQCEKCLRNMIILELLGVLERCTTFPTRTLDLARVSRILMRNAWQPLFYARLRQLAASRDRRDVGRAIQRALRRSRRRRPVLAVSKRLGRIRGLARVGRPLKRWAVAGSVW
jgi:hypothetical protein